MVSTRTDPGVPVYPSGEPVDGVTFSKSEIGRFNAFSSILTRTMPERIRAVIHGWPANDQVQGARDIDSTPRQSPAPVHARAAVPPASRPEKAQSVDRRNKFLALKSGI